MNELNRNYLAALKGEHRAIERLMGEVKFFIHNKDTFGIARCMHSLKISLVEHLKKENDKMYAELSDKAKEKNMEQMDASLRLFSDMMKGIADKALNFFNSYPDKEAVAKLLPKFEEDFNEVNESLLRRIKHEEQVLYALYERHCC
ncbi:MAG: hemerythrin domain-containing protein [Deltaproteobacteria bacterium]|nr:hemerythrin domain-containing protein [Deltaproteobacteria bacterium]